MSPCGSYGTQIYKANAWNKHGIVMNTSFGIRTFGYLALIVTVCVSNNHLEL